MKKIERAEDFCFKGKRTYVHGTDMYKILVMTVKKLGYQPNFLILSFHKLCETNVDLYLLDEGEIASDYVLHATVKDQEKDLTIVGMQSEEKVTCRYEYDESLVTKDTTFSDNKAVVSLSDNYTIIEHLVAATKSYHVGMIEGRWLFSKLKIDQESVSALEKGDQITLIFPPKISRKFTKTKVFIGDSPIGEIYFNLM